LICDVGEEQPELAYYLTNALQTRFALRFRRFEPDSALREFATRFNAYLREYVTPLRLDFAKQPQQTTPLRCEH